MGTQNTVAAMVMAACGTAWAGEDLYNTLGITDEGRFDRAFGCAIGTPPGGATTDLQYADDFVIEMSREITAVTGDFFVKQAEQRLDAVWVQFFADRDGRPSDDVWSEFIAPPDSFVIEDLGVLAGGPAPYNRAVRITVDLSRAGVMLDAGTWWVSIQPVDVRADGNWYWMLRDFDEILGSSDAARDGGAYHQGEFGGYPGLGFFPAWTGLDVGGFRAGTGAMRVQGREPGTGCRADFNFDGFVDFFDYVDFSRCFEGESCPLGRTADFNGDGFVDFFDYADYVAAFEAGC